MAQQDLNHSTTEEEELGWFKRLQILPERGDCRSFAVQMSNSNGNLVMGQGQPKLGTSSLFYQ
jgi:hypothetical protein